MDRKSHWENVYQTKSHREVSWYVEHDVKSLELIARTGVDASRPILDVGGGASTLADDLLAKGYKDITVIDLSGAALGIAKARLGARSGAVAWIEGDILESALGGRTYSLWHDRAVFHFLTEDEERSAYKRQLSAHLEIGGYAVFSVFADDGPTMCSRLATKRHSESDIRGFFGAAFAAEYQERMTHTTPAGIEQRFVNVILKRVG